jgi:hypothetical protein
LPGSFAKEMAGIAAHPTGTWSAVDRTPSDGQFRDIVRLGKQPAEVSKRSAACPISLMPAESKSFHEVCSGSSSITSNLRSSLIG